MEIKAVNVAFKGNEPKAEKNKKIDVLQFTPINGGGQSTRQNSGAKTNKDGDSFVNKQAEAKKKAQAKQQAMARRKTIAWRNRLLGAGVTALVILGGGKAIDTIQPKTPDLFDPKGHTIEEVAEFADSENIETLKRAIITANDLSYEEIQGPLEEKIIVPEKIDPLADEIKEVTDELENPDNGEEKTGELKAKLNELYNDQSEAEKNVDVYSDGVNVYVVPNQDSKLIPLEAVKDWLGIEDGVIKEHNKEIINYGWGIDENGSGYKDYRFSDLPYNGIEVPEGEIDP